MKTDYLWWACALNSTNFWLELDITRKENEITKPYYYDPKLYAVRQEICAWSYNGIEFE